MLRKHKPGYPLVRRTDFYAARMLSSQKGTVTEDTVYEDLQPVYTIWVTLLPKSFPLAGRKAGLRMALDEQTAQQLAMNSGLTNLERRRLEGRADGIIEGIVILIESLLECGMNISNAVEIASAKYGRSKDEVTGIYSSRIRAH